MASLRFIDADQTEAEIVYADGSTVTLNKAFFDGLVRAAETDDPAPFLALRPELYELWERLFWMYDNGTLQINRVVKTIVTSNAIRILRTTLPLSINTILINIDRYGGDRLPGFQRYLQNVPLRNRQIDFYAMYSLMKWLFEHNQFEMATLFLDRCDREHPYRETDADDRNLIGDAYVEQALIAFRRIAFYNRLGWHRSIAYHAEWLHRIESIVRRAYDQLSTFYRRNNSVVPEYISDLRLDIEREVLERRRRAEDSALVEYVALAPVRNEILAFLQLPTSQTDRRFLDVESALSRKRPREE